LEFPEQDIYLEVSSPGIDRIIKDGSEFTFYIGRGIRCYRIDISDWTAGILTAANEKEITLQGEDGEIVLPYETIAKARLYDAAPQISGEKKMVPAGKRSRGINGTAATHGRLGNAGGQ